MDGRRVREFEEEIETAIAKAMRKLKKDGPPPSERVVHLMAKAAVGVLEAADETQKRRNEQ